MIFRDDKIMAKKRLILVNHIRVAVTIETVIKTENINISCAGSKGSWESARLHRLA